MEIQWALLFTLVLETIGAPASHVGRELSRFEAKYIGKSVFQTRLARSINTDDCNQYETCIELDDPVCGTDGITHQNSCKLKQASCQNPEMNIEIYYHGPCSRETEPSTTSDHLITDDPETEVSTNIIERARHAGSIAESSTTNDYLMTDGPENEDSNSIIGRARPDGSVPESSTTNDHLMTDDPEDDSSTHIIGHASHAGSMPESSTTNDHLMTDEPEPESEPENDSSTEPEPEPEPEPENDSSTHIIGHASHAGSMTEPSTTNDHLMTDDPEDDSSTLIIGHAGSMPESNSFCISDVTQDLVPKGLIGYYKCEKYECIGNNTWRNSSERLPGCSPGEVKCWNWYKTENVAVPVGSVMFHKCTQYTCTENDWARTSIRDPSCSGGCMNSVVSKVYPLGTKGYYKCDQVECKPDQTWQPTGERLPNCPAGSVACWNWMTNETVPVGSTMFFECNQYSCTEEHDWDFVLNAEHDPSCEANSCISEITQDMVPEGLKGYYMCDQFECMGNNTWRNTTERLPGCSTDEVKCWDWYQPGTVSVPIGSVMFHKCVKYHCTENDWARTSIRDPSCNVAGGCMYTTVNKVFPLGTKGYQKCDQMECTSDKSWQPTGERLPNCSAGSAACWNWISNETVLAGGTMVFECNLYSCTEHDWQWVQYTTEHDTACEINSCISEITKDVVPAGHKGYFMCDQFECMGNNTWRNTSERLPGCSPGEVKCWNWYQDETVAIGNGMFHKCMQYICTKDDWTKTSILDPSCSVAGGCMYSNVNKVFPLGTKGYHKCEQVECKPNQTWELTGEKLTYCSTGRVACWNWVKNVTVPVGGSMVLECNQYSCTEEHDWQWVQYNVENNPSCEISGCVSQITQDVLTKGFKVYHLCDQFECIGNNTWKNTTERLPGCSSGEVKCWDWNQTGTVSVPIGSVMFHKCVQYACTEDDWARTTIPDPSCSVAGGCMFTSVNKIFPLGTKMYNKCDQLECKPDKTWQTTGEKLSNCSPGNVACWNWMVNETVPVGGTMFFECNWYSCTKENDWQWEQYTTYHDPICEMKSCISDITKDAFPEGTKEYFLCDQFECMGNNTWRNTTERLPGCSPGEVKCWDWYQTETENVAVPIGSVMIHKCLQYNCTENDWAKTSIPGPLCTKHPVNASLQLPACTPGETVINDDQLECCCTTEGTMNCSGPCLEIGQDTYVIPEERFDVGDYETIQNTQETEEEPETATMSDMENAMSGMETTMDETIMNGMETTMSDMKATMSDMKATMTDKATMSDMKTTENTSDLSQQKNSLLLCALIILLLQIYVGFLEF